jgi:hypothetical protein
MVKTLLAVILIATAVCVPIVLLTHRSLMPDGAQLQRLDELVKQQEPPDSRVQRLAAPDRIDKIGGVKTGYFTYLVSDKDGERKLHVDWRIEGDQVQIVSVKNL